MESPHTEYYTADQFERASKSLARHLGRLDDLFGGRELDSPFYIDGINGAGAADPLIESAAFVASAGRDCLRQFDRLADPRVFRPLCAEYNPYGVHFVDRILGATVLFRSGQWWSRPMDTPIGELHPPDLSRNLTWQLAKRAARAFLRHHPPLVYFGLPTIASALNVGVNIYGEQILAALIAEPDAAEHDLAVINEVQCKLHRWYRSRIPADRVQMIVGCQRFQPPGRGQICGCSTQLLSAATYRDLIAPLDAALLGVYPKPGMIHLCGAHTQHIPTWSDMPQLGAVQLNDRASEDLPAYVAGLRPDQVIYFVPCEAIPQREAQRLAAGRPLVLIGEPDET